MRYNFRCRLVVGGLAMALSSMGEGAVGQTTLPEIIVNAPKQTPRPAPRRRAARPEAPSASPAQQTPPVEQTQQANNAFVARANTLDAKRDALLPPQGSSSYQLNQATIQALPQGSNTPIEKVLLQAPGVTQDSAASGNFHVRNEHANVQFRINGILLPDGVAGFGQILETSFIARLTLLTGALPAQYGFHTAGIVDITTRTGVSPGGSISLYGGSRETFTPSFEYGGLTGKTDYFVTGRYFGSSEGIENTTGSLNAIHDHTAQGKFFGYASTMIDEWTRFSVISGASVSKFQIPVNPGQSPMAPFNADPFNPNDFNSALVNENQTERNYYNVFALQKSLDGVDLQLSYYNRYSSVHFVPDNTGDLVFNGVASNIFRSSFVNGIQGDVAYHVNDAHTLRTGFQMSAEQTSVNNTSVVLPLDNNGNPVDAPFNVVDDTSKLGGLAGVYVQDEWKLSSALTLNTGLRFDQMWQFVDANQLSPRASLVYTPVQGTTFHAGYARNFTPPSQVIATPANINLFNNTSAQAASTGNDPVLPERSHVFDAGVVQKVLPGFTVGLDAYYKIARDLLDDGQFGQALVLNGFNYDRATNYGVELKADYQNGNFRAYGNLAWAQQHATTIVSNQFLFAQDELDFIASHYIFTDHAQTWTGSAGASYLWNGTRFSADLIYGSGLRSGFANTDHLPAYGQVNVGISHEYTRPDAKPLTVRFDIVNVFDTTYEIRNGTGIGVFAPQFGPRRGYFLGLSQKL